MIEQTRVVDDTCHTHNQTHMTFYKRLSWTAIIVGALVGVGLTFLLNLFGLAIGLSMFTIDSQGMMVLAMGGLIGILIATVVAMMAAGFTSGYLGRFCCPNKNHGILYGFTTWTVILLMSAVITVHVGNYVTAYTNRLTNTVAMSSVSESNANSVDVVNSKQAVNEKAVRVTTNPSTVAWSAFAVFLLFLVGAVSSCIGAYWGMTCKCVE